MQTSPLQQAGIAPQDTSMMSSGPQPLPGGMGNQPDESEPVDNPQEEEASLRALLESANIAEHLPEEN